MRCSECRWCARVEPPVQDADAARGVVFECRRMNPLAGMPQLGSDGRELRGTARAVWPRVMLFDWCGDFEPKGDGQ